MTQRLKVPDSVGPGMWLRICLYKFPGAAAAADNYIEMSNSPCLLKIFRKPVQLLVYPNYIVIAILIIFIFSER